MGGITVGGTGRNAAEAVEVGVGDGDDGAKAEDMGCKGELHFGRSTMITCIDAQKLL